MKKVLSLIALGFVLAMPVAHAGDDAAAMCEKSAAEKKLAGAAKTSHVKKCMADAKAADPVAAACEKSVADKKLAGAAKTSHIKKCTADGGPGKGGDAKAEAKPAAKAAEAKK